MRYSFFPGCSLEGTAVAYYKSLVAAARALGLYLELIPDWNCCGATVAPGAAGSYTSRVLAARNLALAATRGLDVLVGCSACYLALFDANRRFQEDALFRSRANEALAEGGFSYEGNLRVRQVLEVIARDVGLAKIRERVRQPLTGLYVAGYVGCQTVRAVPGSFDDPENPQFLDQLMEALGAVAVPFPAKVRCCGGSRAAAAPGEVLGYVQSIIEAAESAGASLVVTPCPMCQFNLEVNQLWINQTCGSSFNLPVLFFTQLICVAFGLGPAAGLKHCLVSPYRALASFIL
ncbi:MAG TPA: CoB--CoM heterodisulfide reductase iron-sulfur subunit B family protein [Bacillota bacterium]|nr:CoB--CoM heterodisulfide reductase iron-sulfur subunit B family protein [Peptococcaceae bacterium MAG4]NLW36978.1 disulfide reductase [Peptococcaceae bacterium]HPZ42686.1 CoB--CoM heterodisulfide reductase iron-sulfur subunit B family protein [Bacillota bacterium]HQD75670.1 CoB--CoM heterodisulfide reductase iron-sulfur subunit B family protein [Bacillota bacterium]HUM57940.1 CoB--CoM heterodisulfide reductase iron-sulfur subunit B family protein [Bacillota bacterium]